MKCSRSYKKCFLPLVLCLLLFNQISFSQIIGPEPADSIAPMPSFEEIAARWGPNDTVIVPAVWYRNEIMSYKELGMVWVGNMKGKKLEPK